MPDTSRSLPEQILEASQAFTQTLEMENRVFQNQLEGIVRMTIDALQKLIALCKDAVTIDSAQFDAQQKQAVATLQQASSDAQNVAAKTGASDTPAVPEVPPAIDPNEQDLNAALVQSIGLSYKNAVTAQQQVYVTQQAATTMLITTLISITTATIARTVQEELQKISA